MTMIAENLQHLQRRIAQTCLEAGRDPAQVRLLAVSKTFAASAVQAAYDAGQTAFGENYVQEALDKMAQLAHLPLQWHCIGPLQSNKTRAVATHFQWVHTVDRFKIAQRLSEQRPAHLPALQVCIQVNIDGGVNKSGIAPDETLALAQALRLLPRLELRGLMCIPEPAIDFVAAKAIYIRARALFDALNAAGVPLDTLSMGMSGDWAAAVHGGSTLVRLGSAIFGARS
jgi:PLP dependent protein